MIIHWIVSGDRLSWQMGDETSHFSCMTKKSNIHNEHD